MKEKKNLIEMGARTSTMLCIAALLAAGCANDNLPEGGNDNGGRVTLQVTGGIDVQTRVQGTVWNKGDQIGVYMFKAGTYDIAEDAKNIPYQTTAGDGAFTPAATAAYYPVDGSNVDFHAWYPYADVTKTAWTANLADQSSQPALDLMTADAASSAGLGGTAYNKDHPKVSLSFRHRLTQIVLAITPGNGITTSDLNGLKVEITGQPTAVTYDPQFDAPGCAESYTDITLLTTPDGTSAQAILFPNDVADNTPAKGRQLVFTLNNTKKEVFRWDIPDTKFFNAGEKNTYTITINRTSLNVASQITDWTPGNGEDGETESAE